MAGTEARQRYKLIRLQSARDLELQAQNKILSGIGKDFGKANIAGRALQDCYFANSNWQGANLSQCTFNNVDFSNADFTGANLRGVNFMGREIQGALVGTNLRQAKLDHSAWAMMGSLQGAILDHNNIIHWLVFGKEVQLDVLHVDTFKGTNKCLYQELSDILKNQDTLTTRATDEPSRIYCSIQARLMRRALLEESHGGQLPDIEFLLAQVQKIQRQTQPSHLSIVKSSQELVSASGSFLYSTQARIAGIWQGSDFSGIDLAHKTITDSRFLSASFAHANLQGACFQRVCFLGVIFADADFTGATFQDCDFRGSTVTVEQLKKATLVKCHFNHEQLIAMLSAEIAWNTRVAKDSFSAYKPQYEFLKRKIQKLQQQINATEQSAGCYYRMCLEVLLEKLKQSPLPSIVELKQQIPEIKHPALIKMIAAGVSIATLPNEHFPGARQQYLELEKTVQEHRQTGENSAQFQITLKRLQPALYGGKLPDIKAILEVVKKPLRVYEWLLTRAPDFYWQETAEARAQRRDFVELSAFVGPVISPLLGMPATWATLLTAVPVSLTYNVKTAATRLLTLTFSRMASQLTSELLALGVVGIQHAFNPEWLSMQLPELFAGICYLAAAAHIGYKLIPEARSLKDVYAQEGMRATFEQAIADLLKSPAFVINTLLSFGHVLSKGFWKENPFAKEEHGRHLVVSCKLLEYWMGINTRTINDRQYVEQQYGKDILQAVDKAFEDTTEQVAAMCKEAASHYGHAVNCIPASDQPGIAVQDSFKLYTSVKNTSLYTECHAQGTEDRLVKPVVGGVSLPLWVTPGENVDYQQLTGAAQAAMGSLFCSVGVYQKIAKASQWLVEKVVTPASSFVFANLPRGEEDAAALDYISAAEL